MQTSLAGIGLITEFEGLRLNAYPDIAGLPTIGYGHTRNVCLGTSITPAQAIEFLRADLAERELQVTRVIRFPALQHQFDAMMSFVYNLGIGNFCKSGVLSHFNVGDFPQAAEAFMHWNEANGVVIAGLTRRRIAERTMFEQGIAAAYPPVAPVVIASVPVVPPAPALVAVAPLLPPAPPAKRGGLLGWLGF